MSQDFYSVPNLRFKNYSEEWKKYKVSDLLKTYPTNSLSWEQLSYENVSKLKDIHYGLIHNGFETTCINLDNKLIPYISSESYPKNYEILQIGDLILADASENREDVGRPIEIVNINNQDTISGLHTIHARNKTNLIENGFKGFYFQSHAMKNQIYKIANGSKIYGMSPTNFNELFMCIPCKSEQRKIIFVLSKLEEMIQTQIKIIEDYVILKNSLINRFFTMDNPKVKLSTILTEINIKNKNKQIDTVLSVSNKLGFIKQSEQFEDREVASDDTSNYKIVNKGDYAYNPARINVGSIARLINYDKGIISPMYSCFKINEKKITYTYFDMFLSSSSFKRQLNKKLEGSVRQCLTFEGLVSMDIELPCIETQKSISNKIDMLSYKIKLESDYREALINQKQFLLNNMFI